MRRLHWESTNCIDRRGGLRDESFDVAPLVTDWLAEGMYLDVREDLQPSQSELPIRIGHGGILPQSLMPS